MGRWVVYVGGTYGEYPIYGDYKTLPPAEGGRPEDVIREEQEAAEKAMPGWRWRCPLRACWEDRE